MLIPLAHNTILVLLTLQKRQEILFALFTALSFKVHLLQDLRSQCYRRPFMCVVQAFD